MTQAPHPLFVKKSVSTAILEIPLDSGRGPVLHSGSCTPILHR